MWAFPADFFAFPLNLIFMVMWVVACALLWTHCRKSLFVRFLLSPAATFVCIGLFLCLCLVVGFTGWRWLADSWVSFVITLSLQTVLLFVIIRGWRSKNATGTRLGAVRWRFLLLHVGLLTVVGSAFWGAPDTQTMRMKAFVGEACREVYFMDGRQTWLPYDIVLEGFQVQEYPGGAPSAFSAEAVVDGEHVEIRVNHPYAHVFGEDIYLVGYDAAAGSESTYCILEIVREPWKYVTVIGVLMLLAGAVMLFIGGPSKRSES